MNNFFDHPITIKESNGYGQFSKKHILLLVSVIIFTIIYTIFYINCDPLKQIQIRKIIAIILIVIEILKIIVISIIPVKLSENLPLEICSIAGYLIMIDALVSMDRLFLLGLLTLFLPAAIMALIFPTTYVLPIFNFFTIHQYLFHELIVMYVIGCFVNKEITVTYIGYLKAVVLLCVIVFITYHFDKRFKKNYMFLIDPYNNTMLEKLYRISGGGYKYPIAISLFAFMVTNITFVIFKLLSMLIM